MVTASFFTSCDDSGDALPLDKTLKSGGVVTTFERSQGKLLGALVSPTDIPNSKVILTDDDAELRLQVSAEPGSIPSGVTKYEVVKIFNGVELSVQESTTIPFNVDFDTVTEFFDGFTVDDDALRIADTITFQVKVYLENGDVLYQVDKFNVVINCASSLAGTYVVAAGNPGAGTYIVTEKSPGLYNLSSMLNWPTRGYTVDFTDTCNDTSIINKWQFSNPISGTGKVAANGDIQWSASVTDVYENRGFLMVRQ